MVAGLIAIVATSVFAQCDELVWWREARAESRSLLASPLTSTFSAGTTILRPTARWPLGTGC